MCGEALQRGRTHGLVDQAGEFVEESPTANRRALCCDVARIASVADREGALEDGVDTLGPGGTRVIGGELAAAT